MSVFAQSEWKSWALQWNLTHIPQKGKLVLNEGLVGAHRGYLIRLGWAGEYGNQLYIMIRFPKQPDAQALKDRWLQNARLAELPGGAKALRRWLTVAPSNLLWKRVISWKRPKTEQVQRWVERLIDAVSSTVPAFDGRCEQCRTNTVSSYVLVEQLPVYVCGTCQAQWHSEADMAQRKYDRTEANYAAGALFGAVAAAAGGGAWAGLAIATQRVYALVAIGIAWLVGKAYYMGAQKIDRAGQAIASALTVAGILFGDVIFYAYLAHKYRPDIPFRLDVGWMVLRSQPGESASSVLFGLLGVWYVLKWLQKPRFAPKIEQPQAGRIGTTSSP